MHPRRSNIGFRTPPGKSRATSPPPAGQARATKWREEWSDVVGELPAQINRQQISMISIGGAIGTGLFLGTGQALSHGGPLGLVLGYTLMGTVVYCTVISFGEMVAFQPQIGGPVGLANVYVDEALAFALGWNAWYNWTIVLPTELSASVVLLTYWPVFQNVNLGVWTFVVLAPAIFVNCLGTRWYGKLEVGFTRVKVLTIVTLIVLGLLIDVGASRQGPIFFKNWNNPGPFLPYAFSGAIGRFLGFFSVLLQAAFSFFGSEVPAIAAGEVINANENIPRAIKRIWIRIFLFYVVGVFVISLLVPCQDPSLQAYTGPGAGTATQSPFIIAFNHAGYAGLPHVFNAAFLLSAWSAATSDVYISSRFMFNLARLGHAPKFFGQLYRPRGTTDVAIPWVGILVAAVFSLLAYMKADQGAAADAFNWLSGMTSAAALVAWIGILFTYMRWYEGTVLAIKLKRKKKDDFNRSWMQPYAAYYAFVMCITILLFNGWANFAAGWRLALKTNEVWPPQGSDIVPTFITSYLPIPLFLLLLFGYKLIMQTRMVRVPDMVSSLEFSGFGNVAVEEAKVDTSKMRRWRRILQYLMDFLA